MWCVSLQVIGILPSFLIVIVLFSELDLFRRSGLRSLYHEVLAIAGSQHPSLETVQRALSWEW